MVTREQVIQYTWRKPFAPFRVVVRNQEAVDVTRRLQAGANANWMVVGVPSDGGERTRWIRLDQIERLELLAAHQV